MSVSIVSDFQFQRTCILGSIRTRAMFYYVLVKNPAGGWDIQQCGQRKDAQQFNLRILAPENVHPVWVKDAADCCLALIQNQTKLPMSERLKEANKLLEHKWQEWDEYISYFQGPPRRLPPSWMYWSNALQMER